ncbi:MAG TPA: ABC transporter permease [Planctomycetota bacterium]|nr:ABC transporter permease [Planctomycetota bacterium]
MVPPASPSGVSLEGAATALTVAIPEPLTSETAAAVLRLVASRGSADERVRLDMSGVRTVDTFGLAALASAIRTSRERGRTVSVIGLDPAVRRRAALLRVHDVLDASADASRPATGLVDRVYDGFAGLLDTTVVVLAMLYEGICHALPDCASRALGREHLARQLDAIGIGGVPIVAGVTFLLGSIMAYQTAYVLEFYGATLFVGRSVGISMTRELGPLMAALLLAGRSGSAIAAELGAMVVYEEVDALSMMDLDPRRFLFSPRFAALVIAVPALSVLADVAGVLGGATVMVFSYRIPWAIYFEETITTIYPTDIGSGLIKSVFFGAIIATVSCREGLALRGGPEAVGRAATTAVVESIIAVVVFDAAFTAATRGVL